MNTFDSVVQYLESLSIMPKEMPGIEKIKKALNQTNWYNKIDPKKVIVVAGTNGKGSTCAILESLLVSAHKKVGFYSSPHLIDTTERIRINQKQITKDEFVNIFLNNKELIEKYELTHFEALTLMAGDYFFGNHDLDYVIFEVGLGGTFDATNAMPHATSVITTLGYDHMNILGSTLVEIASNKFGIIQNKNTVIHHRLQPELKNLIHQVKNTTQSTWIEADPIVCHIKKTNQIQPVYLFETKWGVAESSLLGERASENAATALTVFHHLGFNPGNYLSALKQVHWNGRMQFVIWPSMKASLYLSGDHNMEGLQSLIKILKDFSYKNLHVVIGIGKDKEADKMLSSICELSNVHLYLTETPFKGNLIQDYPEVFKSKAKIADSNAIEILNKLSEFAGSDDLVVVTGSLYLVGLILKYLKN